MLLKRNIIKISRNEFDFKCNCGIFLKNFVCEHSLGYSINFKFVNPPVAAKDAPLGGQRKRGRPQKIGSALCK